ncbi:MAG: flagellar hook-length control protein FliK [Bryobacterales bacterium]|nr:flagellar hook-length control protein FliK [Bryobacterales bacterium]
MNEAQASLVRQTPEGRETRAPDEVQREPGSHPKASSQPIKQDFRASPGANLKVPAAEVRSRDTATPEGSKEQSGAQASPDRRPERPQIKTEPINTAQPVQEKRVREMPKETPALAHFAAVASRAALSETRKADGPSGARGETPMAETASPAETQHITAPARESKQITLPLDSAGLRDIEVRLVDQGGRVQVSVHSPDREVRSTLRANLQELIGSLETRGIRTEAAAGGGEPSQSALSDGVSTRESQPRGASDLSPAAPRDFDASRQQQQQQQRTPWLLQTESKKPAPRNADAWQQVLEASWQTPS